jgi:lysine 2,3-aminomutase
MYCRFCTRKRKVSDSTKINSKYIQDGLAYIAAHPEVRDVIISGGDPLMVTDYALERVLAGLREIPHVEIIRIGTKMPCVLPQRITPKLCKMLKKYHPLYINTHFNHPWECTPEATRACSLLADAGIPLGNQAVLMKGVNDDPDIMLELHRKLLQMRVKPYYIYQADLTKGTNHFRTPVRVGLEIMDKLRGHTSGLAIPYYVIDAPGGGGKIPLLPQYVLGRNGKDIILRNFKYEIYTYPDVEDPAVEQHPVEQKYLRKRQNGRRKQVTVPEVTEENAENAEVLMRIEK